MSVIPFDFGWKLSGAQDGLYTCPACGAFKSLHVDTTDEQNITFSCKAGCEQKQILSALGVDPDATVKAIGASLLPQIQRLDMTAETARTVLETLFNVSTFDGFARLAKKDNGGILPTTFDAYNVDQIAEMMGYSITEDRRFWFEKPNFQNIADLMIKNVSPPTFTIEELLPVGLCLFSAPPKTGKTWLALEICNAVANGLPFWGRKTSKGGVLYMSLEGSESGLKERLQAINGKASSNFQYVFKAPPFGSGMDAFLLQWMEQVEAPRLVVIDVIQNAKSSNRSNANSYERDYEIYSPLNKFALDHNISIVGITHNRKSNGLDGDPFESISGSIGQMASAQTAWIITGKRGEQEKTFRATGRDVRDVEDIIVHNPTTLRWDNHGSAEIANEKRQAETYASNPIRKTLIQLLAADSSGVWYGTYDELWEEVADRTGEYPYATGAEMGRKIRPLLALLQQNDGIYHEKDKNRSKYHKFFRKRMEGC